MKINLQYITKISKFNDNYIIEYAYSSNIKGLNYITEGPLDVLFVSVEKEQLFYELKDMYDNIVNRKYLYGSKVETIETANNIKEIFKKFPEWFI